MSSGSTEYVRRPDQVSEGLAPYVVKARAQLDEMLRGILPEMNQARISDGLPMTTSDAIRQRRTSFREPQIMDSSDAEVLEQLLREAPERPSIDSAYRIGILFERGYGLQSSEDR